MFYLYECADMEQLLSEAQHRWLRPAEICEILQNYQKFHIASESPSRPASMFVAEFPPFWLQYISFKVFDRQDNKIATLSSIIENY